MRHVVQQLIVCAAGKVLRDVVEVELLRRPTFQAVQNHRGGGYTVPSPQ
jgi:hypothetical protein